jgi:hypothetical protein
MKKRIHVNQHNIKFNRMLAKQLELYPDTPTQPKPVLTVKTYNSNTLGDEVEIHGPSKLVYQPNKPLSCGARVWIETDAEVHVRHSGENKQMTVIS